ncbi:MAG: HAMP domain-containing protein [Candidatus Riflebacteria bacterium]|nr:HAMP domain-containing protein [Candidatus Riflebacteria bacterium]
MKFLKWFIQRLLFLLILLSPFFVLKNNAGEIKKLRQKEAFFRWSEKTSLISAKLPEVSQIDFWCEEFSRRLLNNIQKQPRQLLENPELLGKKLSREIGKSRIEDFSEPKVWFAVVPPNAERPSMIKENSCFQTTYSYLFRELFHQILLSSKQDNPEMDEPAFLNKYKPMLGTSISGDLFRWANRGKAFHVIHEKSFYVGVWNIIFSGKRPAGIYFLLFPEAPDSEFKSLNALLANWTKIFPGEKVRPVIYKFPVGDKSDRNLDLRLFCHKDLKDLPVKETFRKLNKEFIIKEPKNVSISGNDYIGSLELPDFLKTFSDPFSDSDFWVLPSVLNVSTGCMGFLVQKPDKIPETIIDTVSGTFIPVIFILWVLYIFLFSMTSFRINLSINEQLSVYFLLFSSVPLAIAVGAGEKYYCIKEINLTNHLQNELKRANEKIESGVSKIDTKVWHYFHELTADPEIYNNLRKCSMEKDYYQSFLKKINGDLENLAVFPQMVLFFGVDGEELTWYGSQTKKEFVDITKALFRGIAYEIFEKGIPGYKAPSEKKEFSGQKILGNNQKISILSDSIDSLLIGNRRLPRYFNRIYSGDKLKFIVASFWTHGNSVEMVLKDSLNQYFLDIRSISESSHSSKADFSESVFSGKAVGMMDPFFSIFSEQSDRYKNVCDAGNRKSNVNLKKKINNWGISDNPEDFLIVSTFSKKVPGYLIVSGISLDQLKEYLVNERNRNLALLFSLILITLSALKMISNQMARPIRLISETLKKAAKNELDISLPEHHGDELGEASGILNRMIAWLREKQSLSRFVSDRVLTVVSGNDASLECEPSEHDSVQLVSDIRSFTTLSEKHLPGEMFSLLNVHLESMTRIIVKHGGDIERYVGDAIQAVFSSGEKYTDSLNAVNAALEMTERLKEINSDRNKSGSFTYEIGIGIDSGRVITAITGDRNDKLDMTVLGESMRNAAELESLSRNAFNTKIICSEKIREILQGKILFYPLAQSAKERAWEVADSLKDKKAENVQCIENSDSDRLIITQNRTFLLRSFILWLFSFLKKPVPYILGFSKLKNYLFYYPMCLVLWMIPMMLLFSQVKYMESSDRAREESSVASFLEDLSGKIEKSADNSQQVAIFLHEKLKETAEAMLKVSANSKINVLEESMKSVCSFFPNASWYYIESEFQPEEAMSFTDLLKNVPIASGGKELMITRSRISNLFSSFQAELWFTEIAPTAQWKVLGQLTEGNLFFGNNFIKPSVQSSIDNLSSVLCGNEQKLFIWLPVQAPVFPENEKVGFRIDNPIPWHCRSVRHHLKSGIFFFIDPNDVNPDIGKMLLIKNLEKESVHSALIDLATGKRRCSSIFSRDNVENIPDDFRNSISEILPTAKMIGKASGKRGDWIYLSREILLDGEYLLVLVKKMFIPETRTKILKIIIGCLSVIWFTIGSWLFIQRGMFRKMNFFPLKYRLSGSFILVVVLLLTFCLLTLEKNLSEEKSFIRLDIQRKHSAEFRQIELDSDLVLSWFCGFMNYWVEKSKVLKFFSEIKDMPVKSDRFNGEIVSFQEHMKNNNDYLAGKLQHSVDNTFGTEFIEQANKELIEMMNDLYSFFLRKGLNAAFPVFCGQGLVMDFDSGFEYKSKRLWRNALVARYSEILTGILPENNSRRQLINKPSSEVKNMVMDDLNCFFSAVLSARDAAAISHSRKGILESVFFGDSNAYMYHKYIFPSIDSGFVFLCELRSSSIDNNIYLSRYNSPVQKTHFLTRQKLAYELKHPYLINVEEKNGRCTLTELYGLSDLNDIFMMKITSLSDTSSFFFEGSGKNETLTSIQSNSDMKNRMFYKKVNVYQFFSGILSSIFRTNMFLLSVLIFISVSVIIFSNRFLFPITLLISSTREVMKENFSQVLPDFDMIEYQNLSIAFNKMLIGLKERSRIQKFVSESVRKVAVDQTFEKTAMEGESLEVTILFAGLANFKKRISTCPPKKLVAELNRYLEKMSAIIRNHNGEIDKFIGDKILAVFRHEKFQSDDYAVFSALRSAKMMIHSMNEADSGIDDSIGIGIVTGRVIAGIMGSSFLRRREYTVFGDTVNLASRLCDLSCKRDSSEKVQIILEARAREILLNSENDELVQSGKKLEKLSLPPIKGKTRSVEAFSAGKK